MVKSLEEIMVYQNHQYDTALYLHPDHDALMARVRAAMLRLWDRRHSEADKLPIILAEARRQRGAEEPYRRARH